MLRTLGQCALTHNILAFLFVSDDLPYPILQSLSFQPFYAAKSNILPTEQPTFTIPAWFAYPLVHSTCIAISLILYPAGNRVTKQILDIPSFVMLAVN
jgi:hypothetical protein